MPLMGEVAVKVKEDCRQHTAEGSVSTFTVIMLLRIMATKSRDAGEGFVNKSNCH